MAVSNDQETLFMDYLADGVTGLTTRLPSSGRS